MGSRLLKRSPRPHPNNVSTSWRLPWIRPSWQRTRSQCPAASTCDQTPARTRRTARLDGWRFVNYMGLPLLPRNLSGFDAAPDNLQLVTGGFDSRNWKHVVNFSKAFSLRQSLRQRKTRVHKLKEQLINMQGHRFNVPAYPKKGAATKSVHAAERMNLTVQPVRKMSLEPEPSGLQP